MIHSGLWQCPPLKAEPTEALKRKTKEVGEMIRRKQTNKKQNKKQKKGKIDHDFKEEGVTCFIERSKRKEKKDSIINILPPSHQVQQNPQLTCLLRQHKSPHLTTGWGDNPGLDGHKRPWWVWETQMGMEPRIWAQEARTDWCWWMVD